MTGKILIFFAYRQNSVIFTMQASVDEGHPPLVATKAPDVSTTIHVAQEDCFFYDR